jgi:hypothetical protein
MKCSEIVSEGKGGVAGKRGLKADHAHALPHAHYYPELDNSSGYKAYRFGVALAGIPHQKADKEGPTGQKMVTIAYAPEENSMLDAAAAYFGTAKEELTPPGSTEADDTHKKSPYRVNGPIALNKKK